MLLSVEELLLTYRKKPGILSSDLLTDIHGNMVEMQLMACYWTLLETEHLIMGHCDGLYVLGLCNGTIKRYGTVSMSQSVPAAYRSRCRTLSSSSTMPACMLPCFLP